MLSGDFQHLLQELNPEITFEWNNNNGYKTRGAYLKRDDNGRAEFLFGYDNEWLPERTIQDSNTGEIKVRGWKDLLLILWGKGLVKDKELYREKTRGWRPHPA